MIDMKNRATAVKLTPLDDDMAEPASVRLAGSQSTTPPAADADGDFAPELLTEAPRLRSAPFLPSPPRRISAPSKRAAATRCWRATSATWQPIR